MSFTVSTVKKLAIVAALAAGVLGVLFHEHGGHLHLRGHIDGTVHCWRCKTPKDGTCEDFHGHSIGGCPESHDVFLTESACDASPLCDAGAPDEVCGLALLSITPDAEKPCISSDSQDFTFALKNVTGQQQSINLEWMMDGNDVSVSCDDNHVSLSAGATLDYTCTFSSPNSSPYNQCVSLTHEFQVFDPQSSCNGVLKYFKMYCPSECGASGDDGGNGDDGNTGGDPSGTTGGDDSCFKPVASPKSITIDCLDERKHYDISVRNEGDRAGTVKVVASSALDEDAIFDCVTPGCSLNLAASGSAGDDGDLKVAFNATSCGQNKTGTVDLEVSLENGADEFCADVRNNPKLVSVSFTCSDHCNLCGNGKVDLNFGETCDYHANDPPKNCRESGADACTHCGDGVLQGDAGELCDGQKNNRCPHGCLSNCLCAPEPPPSPPKKSSQSSINSGGTPCDSAQDCSKHGVAACCRNGSCLLLDCIASMYQRGCECVPLGNSSQQSKAQSSVSSSVSSKKPSTTCGNHKIDAGEQCERGVKECGPSRACEYKTCTCLLEGALPTCGNGKLDPYEQCDGRAGGCHPSRTCDQRVCTCIVKKSSSTSSVSSAMSPVAKGGICCVQDRCTLGTCALPFGSMDLCNASCGKQQKSSDGGKTLPQSSVASVQSSVVASAVKPAADPPPIEDPGIPPLPTPASSIAPPPQKRVICDPVFHLDRVHDVQADGPLVLYDEKYDGMPAITLTACAYRNPSMLFAGDPKGYLITKGYGTHTGNPRFFSYRFAEKIARGGFYPWFQVLNDAPHLQKVSSNLYTVLEEYVYPSPLTARGTHYAVTFRQRYGELYRDGVAYDKKHLYVEYPNDLRKVFSDPASPLTIGGMVQSREDSGVKFAYPGKIAHARIYPCALSPDVIAELARECPTVSFAPKPPKQTPPEVIVPQRKPSAPVESPTLIIERPGGTGSKEQTPSPADLCGNGEYDEGEQCEKGLPFCVPGRICDEKSCTCIPEAASPLCGNGLLDELEHCDGEEGVCPSVRICDTSICTCILPIEEGEEPEDASEVEEVLCGNGEYDTGEQCDKNLDLCVPPRTCDLESCTCLLREPLITCGNGTLDPGEHCDGNLGTCVPGRACNALCTCVPDDLLKASPIEVVSPLPDVEASTTRSSARSLPTEGLVAVAVSSQMTSAPVQPRTTPKRASQPTPTTLTSAQYFHIPSRTGRPKTVALVAGEYFHIGDGNVVTPVLVDDPLWREIALARASGQLRPLASNQRSPAKPVLPQPPARFTPPLGQLQPLIMTRGPVGDTGPAAAAVIGAGIAGGWSWVRRRKR